MSRLHQAAMRGDLKLVNELLAAKEDPGSADENGWTPLHLAAQHGHFHVVEALLAAKADPNAARNGVTPLHVAAENGQLEIAAALLDANADVDPATAIGATPLFIAAQHEHVDVVELLLTAKANPDARLKTGHTPLYIAAMNGNVPIVTALILANADSMLGERDMTPLHVAAARGKLDVVNVLLEAGVSPDPSLKSGETPIYLAAQNRHQDIVDVLLEALDEDPDSKLYSLPENQLWLIKRMQALGYQSHPGGLCYGLAYMAMQAILAGDMTTFEHRLELINELPADMNEFKKAIDEVRQQRIKDKGRLHSLPPYEQMILEIPAFFEGIELYHQAYIYRELFAHESMTPESQDVHLTAPLVLPRALEPGTGNKAGLNQIASFSGVYTKTELTAYFEEFANACREESTDTPVPLILKSSNHVVTVGFDPSENKWLFFDGNRSGIGRYISSAARMADLVNFAFNGNDSDTSIFSTSMYADNAKAASFAKCAEAWKSSARWKSMHAVSEQKARLIDVDGASWLYVAAMDNQLDVVNSLLAVNADPSWQLVTKLSPLHIAAQNGNVDVINALLAKNANVNSIGPDGITPLMMAVENGRVGAVNALLSTGANPSIVAADGSTALYLAAATNRPAIIRTLLDLNVDASLAARYQNRGKMVEETPVQAARRKGFHEAASLIQADLDRKSAAAQTVSSSAHTTHSFHANPAASVTKTAAVPQKPADSTASDANQVVFKSKR